MCIYKHMYYQALDLLFEAKTNFFMILNTMIFFTILFLNVL